MADTGDPALLRGGGLDPSRQADPAIAGGPFLLASVALVLVCFGMLAGATLRWDPADRPRLIAAVRAAFGGPALHADAGLHEYSATAEPPSMHAEAHADAHARGETAGAHGAHDAAAAVPHEAAGEHASDESNDPHAAEGSGAQGALAESADAHPGSGGAESAGHAAEGRTVPARAGGVDALVAATKRGLAKRGLQDAVQIATRADGVDLEADSELVFARDSVELRAEAAQLLDQVVELAVLFPLRVSVEVHTAVPPAEGRPAAPWELASGRAVAAVRYIIEIGDLDPARARVIGAVQRPESTIGGSEPTWVPTERVRVSLSLASADPISKPPR
jgi:flagellar motor protein MotB